LSSSLDGLGGTGGGERSENSMGFDIRVSFVLLLFLIVMRDFPNCTETL